jgi:hypothetical protein
VADVLNLARTLSARQGLATHRSISQGAVSTLERERVLTALEHQPDGLTNKTSVWAVATITAKKVTVMLKLLNWVVNVKSAVF